MRALCLTLLVLGCAKGSSGRPDGSIRDRDTSADVPTRDAPRTDSTIGENDTGGCADDSHPEVCADAVDLGTIDMGGTMTVMGKLPTLSDEDWFTVAFPPLNMPNQFGGGTPTIELEGDATMVFEIRTGCMASFSCGEGIPRELTSFSFVDDQSMGPDPVGEVPNDYSTRDKTWPDVLKIRVARRGGPATCDDYTLTVTR